MVIEFNDVTSPGALHPLDPARPWLPEAATFINVTDEPGISTDLQIFCSYSPQDGLAVHELGLIVPRDSSNLGLESPTGVDLRDLVRRALRTHAGDEVTDAEIEEVLPRHDRALRLDVESLTVSPVVDPWFYGDTSVIYAMVTPDLCVPNVIEVAAQDHPRDTLAIVVSLVLDASAMRYDVVHAVMRHYLGADHDLGADPFQGVDLASFVRRALVGIAPTGDPDLTIESFLPGPRS